MNRILQQRVLCNESFPVLLPSAEKTSDFEGWCRMWQHATAYKLDNVEPN